MKQTGGKTAFRTGRRNVAQRRTGLFLCLTALLFNLFGWLLIPPAAQAAITTQDTLSLQSPVGETIQADVCHSLATSSDTAQLPTKGAPRCIQCFPLLSSCSGAVVPQDICLPEPPAITQENSTPTVTSPHRPTIRLIHGARAPPCAA